MNAQLINTGFDMFMILGRACVDGYIETHVYVVHTYVSVCMCVCVCMYARMCLYVCGHVSVCMCYVYVCVYSRR